MKKNLEIKTPQSLITILELHLLTTIVTECKCQFEDSYSNEALYSERKKCTTLI